MDKETEKVVLNLRWTLAYANLHEVPVEIIDSEVRD